jgi:hypothetical protein
MKGKKTKQVLSGIGTVGRGRIQGKGEGRYLWWKYYVLCMKMKK